MCKNEILHSYLATNTSALHTLTKKEQNKTLWWQLKILIKIDEEGKKKSIKEGFTPKSMESPQYSNKLGKKEAKIDKNKYLPMIQKNSWKSSQMFAFKHENFLFSNSFDEKSA